MDPRFWTDAEVRAALGLGEGDAERGFRAVSTDTRSIGEGDLFVALQGERFDAHDFLAQAAASGASGAVVRQEGPVASHGMTLYPVDDPLAALQQLAAHRRSKHRARFIGVVGSNGKTTTKELIRAVLGTRYRTHATRANLNNQIGVPLTVLGLPGDAEAAVIEMGTDRPGEIAALTEVVKPDQVVVTSIGEEHLDRLGDLRGVLEEEISVLRGLAPGGLAFVAEEPGVLPNRAREVVGESRLRVAGFGEGADLRPDGGEGAIRYLEDGSTVWTWQGIEIRLPIPGKLNVRNALLALGVGAEMGIPVEAAAPSLAEITLPSLRGEWIRYGTLRVLADCYNSNPPGLAAAVELLGSLPVRGRRVAVVGTMRELGAASERLHAAVADEVARLLGDRIDLVVATGDFAHVFAPYEQRFGGRVVCERDPLEAYENAAASLTPTDTILLKASRGERLERWLPLLARDFGGG